MKMAKPRVFTPENRLAKSFGTTAGASAPELIAAAQVRVTAMGPALRAHVSEKLETIMRYAPEGDDVLLAESHHLGAAALSIAEVAGAAGLETVGEVARGISAMVENFAACGVCHTDALRLHVQALSLASQSPDDASEENRLMLERLRTMRKVLDVAE
jgi:hypothetical protein